MKKLQPLVQNRGAQSLSKNNERLSNSLISYCGMCMESCCIATADVSNLKCGCKMHFHCFILYVRSKLKDQKSFHRLGIRCPYFSMNVTNNKCSGNTNLSFIGLSDLVKIMKKSQEKSLRNRNIKKNIYTVGSTSTADMSTGNSSLSAEELEKFRQWMKLSALSLRSFATSLQLEQVVCSVTPRSLKSSEYIHATTKACPECGFRSRQNLF